MGYRVRDQSCHAVMYETTVASPAPERKSNIAMGKLVYGPPGVKAPAMQPMSIPRHPDSAASHFWIQEGGTMAFIRPSHMKAQRMMGSMVRKVFPLLFNSSTGTPLVFQTAIPNKTAVTETIRTLLSHISITPEKTLDFGEPLNGAVVEKKIFQRNFACPLPSRLTQPLGESSLKPRSKVEPV